MKPDLTEFLCGTLVEYVGADGLRYMAQFYPAKLLNSDQYIRIVEAETGVVEMRQNVTFNEAISIYNSIQPEIVDSKCQKIQKKQN